MVIGGGVSMASVPDEKTVNSHTDSNGGEIHDMARAAMPGCGTLRVQRRFYEVP